MKATMRTGLSATTQYTVSARHTVPYLLPESGEFAAMPEVLASGYLVGIVELACMRLIDGQLDIGEQSVGVHFDVSHEAPTQPGATVAVSTVLEGIDGRRLTFDVEARDEHAVICRGRHQRVVIDRARFDATLADRRAARYEAAADQLADQIQVVALDIFGTTVDWHTGITEQAAQVAGELGAPLDAGALADAWRDRYLPAIADVRAGRRPWANLDTLHRESLDELLDAFGIAGAFDETARQQLVHLWHRLPAWPDVPDGLRRLRNRRPVIALSNGGFALLTRLTKHAGLHFDAIISAENLGTYKPDPQSYIAAAELLDVTPEHILMVASHRRDIDGARTAGLRTAFLERPTEKGPHRPADRAADITKDLTIGSLIQLADILGY